MSRWCGIQCHLTVGLKLNATKEKRVGRIHARSKPSRPSRRRTGTGDHAEGWVGKEEDRAALSFEHAPCSIWFSRIACCFDSFSPVAFRSASRERALFCSYILLVIIVVVAFLLFLINMHKKKTVCRKKSYLLVTAPLPRLRYHQFEGIINRALPRFPYSSKFINSVSIALHTIW